MCSVLVGKRQGEAMLWFEYFSAIWWYVWRCYYLWQLLPGSWFTACAVVAGLYSVEGVCVQSGSVPRGGCLRTERAKCTKGLLR